MCASGGILMAMKVGWSQHDRLGFLEGIPKIEGQTHPIEFQGHLQYMPMYRVPIGLPRYRLDNIRTMAAQEERQVKDELSEDFFQADPESDNVHRIQHELLSELLHEQGLNEKFEKPNITQNEPLILTHDGIVANGNRRLACWRNLFEQDAGKYEHYANIDVVILPQCDDLDIVRLEAKLQLEQDIRASYGWATTAIGLRRAINPPFDMSHQEAASVYRIGKVSEVQRKIDELEYAEDYLSTRGLNKEYSAVADKEFAFKRMVSLRSKMASWDQAKKMKFEFLAFNLIDKPEGHGDLYRQILLLYNNLDAVIEQVIEDHKDVVVIDIPEEDDEEASDETYGFFTEGEAAKPINWKELSNEELGEENSDKVRESIWDGIQSGEALRKAGNKQNFVYNKMKDAHKLIQQAVSSSDDSMTRDGVETKINEIALLLEQVKEWVDNGEN
jgi:hypothetical protein